MQRLVVHTWTFAPVTRLGLSQGLPPLFAHSAIFSWRQDQLAWWPPMSPTVPAPTACAPCSIGALNRRAIMFTHRSCTNHSSGSLTINLLGCRSTSRRAPSYKWFPTFSCISFLKRRFKLPEAQWWWGTRPCQYSSCWGRTWWACHTRAPSMSSQMRPSSSEGCHLTWARRWWSDMRHPWAFHAAEWKTFKSNKVTIVRTIISTISLVFPCFSKCEVYMIVLKAPDDHLRNAKYGPYVKKLTWEARPAHIWRQTWSRWCCDPASPSCS